MVNNQATAEFNDYLTQMMTSLSLYLQLLSKQLYVGNLTFITPCSKHIQP